MNLRWKTQWHPAPDWTIDNTAAFSLSRQSGYPYEYAGSGEVNYNDTCFYRRNLLTDGLTVKWTRISCRSTISHLHRNAMSGR